MQQRPSKKLEVANVLAIEDRVIINLTDKQMTILAYVGDCIFSAFFIKSDSQGLSH